MMDEDNNDGESTDGFPARKKKKTRPPAKITARHLENVALYYLERFATSSENLRAVLKRRVYKSARFHQTDPDQGYDLVDQLITRFLSSGLLDDQAYANFRVTTLRRRGKSRRAIISGLLAKGLGKDIIERAFEKMADANDEGNDELQAALTYARKRRLGRYGNADDREDRRDRDLGKLARAGFSYDIALAIIDGDEGDEF